MTGLPTALEAARRIADRIGEREPRVQAWQHLDMNAARNMARHLDQFGSGLLKGIPIGVKDIIDTADMRYCQVGKGLEPVAGSRA